MGDYCGPSNPNSNAGELCASSSEKEICAYCGISIFIGFVLGVTVFDTTVLGDYCIVFEEICAYCGGLWVTEE